MNDLQSDTMLGNPGIYAAKKRKKPVQKPKKLPGADGVVKSNPSKRHRDRLNGELDRLTDLLPFSEEVRTRLDKLSVLRLSVGYMRVKSFFKATMKKSTSSAMFPRGNGLNGNGTTSAAPSEGDLLLQALSGFVMVVTDEGSVFYASPTVQDYLGFHQSDVVHQSVYELIHTDDRALFRQQLHFALNPTPFGPDQGGFPSAGDTVKYDPEQLPPENSSFLERNFVCRFRCLLDNSSGFLALKFHGRLKYLHGQSLLNENGTCMQPQLALFTIATPVQPPSILEIRSKTHIFQTKHKLDFTPTGIDGRGTVVLGYTEIEISIRGSGYQFIHAADMMYCADKHFRMMKTGESGMTVFRLLTKSRGWQWVQSNAKLVYKGGRPEFIIARQRALLNTEGEEHMRQRRMQLPFSCSTGEGVLYEQGPTLDPTQAALILNKPKEDMDIPARSLLGCFLAQDKTIYTQTAESSQSMDQMFMDSRALVNIHPDAGVVVKEESKQSRTDLIDTLEKMAQDGDLCAALESLEVDAAELMELENALTRLQGEDQQGTSCASELDNILTNDIFTYMDTVLFKDNLTASQPSCLSNPDLFGQEAQPSAAELRETHVFPGQSADHTPSQVNSLCARQQGSNNGPVSVGQSVAGPAQIFGTLKLSHYGPLVPQTDPTFSLPQLQLPDIFSPSIELPELSLPVPSGNNPSCGQASISHMGIPVQTQSSQLKRECLPLNGMQAPPMAVNGQLLQRSVQQPNSVAPIVIDNLPSLIPCNDFSSPAEPTTHSVSLPFPTGCLQGNAPFQTHSNHRVQPWPQGQQHGQQQKLPTAGIMQNGYKGMAAFHSQPSASQRFPPAGLWPQGLNGLNHTQQGGLADGKPALPNSCMFDKCSLPLSNGGRPPGRSDTPLDQSPPQGSCYYQWGRGEPVVGTSAIIQENTSVSPPSHPLQPTMTSPQDVLAMQHYLERSEQTQNPNLPAESNGLSWL